MTHHDPLWHALEAERLTEMADLLSVELDFSHPGMRSRMEMLLDLARQHAVLAQILPVEVQVKTLADAWSEGFVAGHGTDQQRVWVNPYGGLG